MSVVPQLLRSGHNRPIASHSEGVFARDKLPDLVAPGPHQITRSHR
jgi:hypothetical protein